MPLRALSVFVFVCALSALVPAVSVPAVADDAVPISPEAPPVATATPTPSPTPTPQPCPDPFFGGKTVWMCLTFDSISEVRSYHGYEYRYVYFNGRSLGSAWNFTFRPSEIEGNEICACSRLVGFGCFDPDSSVATADGGSRLVRDVSANDLLLNPVTGKSAVVQRVIESAERAPLIEISCASGATTQVSQAHPVLTDSGVKQARRLSLADKIMVAGGEFSELTELRLAPLEDGQRVINFVMDGPGGEAAEHMLLVDGVVSGDYVLQNRLRTELKE